MTTGKLPWTNRNQKKLFQQIRKGEYSIPSNISESCSNLIRRMMTVNNYNRITIDDALNHPFLKEVQIKSLTFEQKYVSMNKINLILSNEDGFKSSNSIPDTQLEFESQNSMNYIKIRKCIETDDDKKKKIEKLKDNEKDELKRKQTTEMKHEEKKKGTKKNKIIKIIKRITHKKTQQ